VTVGLPLKNPSDITADIISYTVTSNNFAKHGNIATPRYLPTSFRLPVLKIGMSKESFHLEGKVPVESEKLKCTKEVILTHRRRV
jgi:hypothetical protein